MTRQPAVLGRIRRPSPARMSRSGREAQECRSCCRRARSWPSQSFAAANHLRTNDRGLLPHATSRVAHICERSELMWGSFCLRNPGRVMYHSRHNPEPKESYHGVLQETCEESIEKRQVSPALRTSRQPGRARPGFLFVVSAMVGVFLKNAAFVSGVRAKTHICQTRANVGPHPALKRRAIFSRRYATGYSAADLGLRNHRRWRCSGISKSQASR